MLEPSNKALRKDGLKIAVANNKILRAISKNGQKYTKRLQSYNKSKIIKKVSKTENYSVI